MYHVLDIQPRTAPTGLWLGSVRPLSCGTQVRVEGPCSKVAKCGKYSTRHVVIVDVACRNELQLCVS